jgi:hypothetical protein
MGYTTTNLHHPPSPLGMADPESSHIGLVSGFRPFTTSPHLRLQMEPLWLPTLRARHTTTTTHSCRLTRQARNQATVAWFWGFSLQPPPLLHICERMAPTPLQHYLHLPPPFPISPLAPGGPAKGSTHIRAAGTAAPMPPPAIARRQHHRRQ